jgi:hypothetical protein
MNPGMELPEPMLRPKGTASFALDVARRARVYANGSSLVVRERSGHERRYAVGENGILQAVFYPPSHAGEETSRRLHERWGVVVFEGSERSHVLQIPLAEWLPEAEIVGTSALSPEECLQRTGLKQLANKLGIPLNASAEPWSSSVSERYGRGRHALAANWELPVWHSWVRGLGMLVWFIAFLFPSFLLGEQARWGPVIAAGALLAVAVSDVVVRTLVRLRARADVRLAEAATILPSPGSASSRRFCRTAAVRVLPRDIVVTNGLGEERWLARSGSQSVARLVRLVHAKSGEHLGVEFRGSSGEPRALLPWRWWFAGPEGDDRWAELTALLGVPTEEERLKPGSEPWWREHRMSEDARRMSPVAAKEARRRTSWYGSALGDATWMIVPVLSALPLAAALLGDGRTPAVVMGILSSATIAVIVGSALGHQLISRLDLDRPVREE